MHREPKASIIVRRFQFNSRTRSLDESVADYVAGLRRLAEHCGFNGMLEEMLRDRVVCGINNSAIQKRLLAESDLTLTKAISVAQAAEIADTGVRELQSSTGASSGFSKEEKSLHKFTTTDNSSKSKDCYHCGAKHNPDQCCFKSEKCHACGKQGHIAKVCRSKKKLHTSKSESRLQPTNQVIEFTSSTTDYTLFPVSNPEGKPLQTTVDVEDHPFMMEIDTGAAVSLINETTYKSQSKLPLQSLMVQLRMYTGETISVTGEILVKVQSGRQSHSFPLLIVPGQGPSLLGRNWLLMLQLDWKNIFSFCMII